MRSSDGDGWLVISAGGAGTVASIDWYYGNSDVGTSSIFGGTNDGLVLWENEPDGTWTAYCIGGGQIQKCH